jgi:tetratricopeptide (TPR) repeat protein
MSEVFISYRQTNDEQKQRVREFAERLRAAGIDVILDQFFLEEHPEGPSEPWCKWSSDRALETEYVLIIGTQQWFQCFEKRQPPGTGLGAACEADDLRMRIYEAGGVISKIRVVLFDRDDTVHIPGKLRGYHTFDVERDFKNIVRWLGKTIDPNDAPRTSIPHNLPSLQPFFGREKELKRIADALDPESRTWGALIDGPGGIGKTSLAVRAAYDASAERFNKIVFVSLKSRELDDDGVRDLSGFLISGLAELLNELARELGRDEIAKAPDDQRPRMLLDALRGTRALLLLDNLESLLKGERDIVFTFVKKLPAGCKAILTSRGRIGSAAEELILEKLSQSAALATLTKLAETNEALEKTRPEERLELYRETGGKPLLLRWTAGQIGRGSCLTLREAIAYLRSCPEGNDPLEFIFGDLVEDFTDAEMRVLCALSYFTLPAKVEHITELAERPQGEVEVALRSLVNRSLVVPSEELETFTLVPLVADFLRKKKPEVIRDVGYCLEQRAYALLVENGYNHDRFPVLDAVWPTIAAALPQFLAGTNERLQKVCDALHTFLNFTGRWDERLAFWRDAESRAVGAGDFREAGWRAFQAGWIHYARKQSNEVLACAARAATHWDEAKAGARERASAIRLRGDGYRLGENYAAAILAYREAVDLWRTLGHESKDVARGLNSLAEAEQASGDLNTAEHVYGEALRMARAVGYGEGVAYITGNLAELALNRGNWSDGEALARQALVLSEEIGRLELIAVDCLRLAKVLVRQDKSTEALGYAQRSVEIFTRLRSPQLAVAIEILGECQPNFLKWSASVAN